MNNNTPVIYQNTSEEVSASTLGSSQSNIGTLVKKIGMGIGSLVMQMQVGCVSYDYSPTRIDGFKRDGCAITPEYEHTSLATHMRTQQAGFKLKILAKEGSTIVLQDGRYWLHEKEKGSFVWRAYNEDGSVHGSFINRGKDAPHLMDTLIHYGGQFHMNGHLQD